MPIIRRLLTPSTVYPENIRYNEGTDTVQSNVNGTWVDNPEADPRTQTTFPARITSNPACDAAESVKDAIKTQVDGVLEAIDNSATLFTIAGIILSIFTFGVFGIFISIALGIGDAMLSAGTAAINAALTEPVYHTFMCILSCHFNSGGRLNDGGLDAAMTEITDQIGGLGATILNSMLSLAGEGGVNNLAALGTSTGDCSDCGCFEWCYTFDFTLGALGWSAGAQCGTVTSLGAGGWSGGCNSCSYYDTTIQLASGFTGNLGEVDFHGVLSGSSPSPDWGIEVNGTVVQSGSANVGDDDYHAFSLNITDPTSLRIWMNAQCGYTTEITRVTLKGFGTNPFGSNNCP